MKFDYVDKILEIVQAGAGKEGKLLYVADCSRLDTFTSLDKTLLQALINSSAEKSTLIETQLDNIAGPWF